MVQKQIIKNINFDKVIGWGVLKEPNLNIKLGKT